MEKLNYDCNRACPIAKQHTRDIYIADGVKLHLTLANPFFASNDNKNKGDKAGRQGVDRRNP